MWVLAVAYLAACPLTVRVPTEDVAIGTQNWTNLLTAEGVRVAGVEVAERAACTGCSTLALGVSVDERVVFMAGAVVDAAARVAHTAAARVAREWGSACDANQTGWGLVVTYADEEAAGARRRLQTTDAPVYIRVTVVATAEPWEVLALDFGGVLVAPAPARSPGVTVLVGDDGVVTARRDAPGANEFDLSTDSRPPSLSARASFQTYAGVVVAATPRVLVLATDPPRAAPSSDGWQALTWAAAAAIAAAVGGACYRRGQ